MRIIIYILFSLLTGLMTAQDNHYSLYQFRSGGLNPGLTGFNQADGEVRTLYRTQWNTITPITFITLEAEKQDDLWGYGISWNKNGAGVGSLISNQLTIGASRQVNLNSDGLLRLGMQMGYFQHSLDWNGAVFESQFNPNGTIETENGENLILQSASSLDLNVGLFYSQKAGPNTINIGAGLFHLAQKKLTLFSEETNEIRSKKTIFASIELPTTKNWIITPNFLFQNQVDSRESILAINAKKQFEPSKSISFGTGIRLQDAIIIQTEFQLENISIAIAYDTNISKLRSAGGGFGAFEIGFKFRFKDPYDYKDNVNKRMQDSDNDGIADDSDHCPNIPGDISNKGCPGRADSDGDGIVDEVDLCPGLAGSSIHGGCPDSDGDGVADIDDECPTIYGALHFQGCPDSDQDGISDKYDACPTTFGLISNKGCPDAKAVPPAKNLGEHLVIDINYHDKNTTQSPPTTYHKHSYRVNDFSNEQRLNEEANPQNPTTILSEQFRYESPGKTLMKSGEILYSLTIYFDSNDSVLDQLDKRQLRDFITTLESDPKLKLVLKGYTGEEGDELYSMELGHRRSESVKKYLLQFGVNENKVLTLSSGEEIPNDIIQENNKRVKLLLVK